MLQTQRVQTLEQIRAFVEGTEAVDFAGGDRAGVFTLVPRHCPAREPRQVSKARNNDNCQGQRRFGPSGTNP